MARLIGRRGFLASGAAAAGVAAAGPARAAFGDLPVAGSVTLAVLAPFTGEDAKLGEQLGNGVRAAIDDANRLHTTFDKLYTMRTFDDQDLLASGLLNAQFACDDATVLCVIGHLKGRITDAVLQTYVTNHMPVIVPASTYDRLTAHGYGNIVRMTVKDSTEGRLGAAYVNATAKPKSVVALYQDGDYGYDVVTGFQERMASDKVPCKTIQFAWEKPDFKAVAASIVAAAPEAVYLAGLTSDMGGLLAPLKKAGYGGPLFASQGFYDAATIDKHADLVEGLTVSTSMPPLNLAPSAMHVVSDFQQRYGPMTPISAFSYAATQVALQIVKRTGAADRIAVERALAYTSAYDTVVGRIAFQSDGDPQDPNVYFYSVTDGKWKYLRAAHRSEFVLK